MARKARKSEKQIAKAKLDKLCPDKKPTKASESIERLNPKQAAYVEGVIEGKTKQQAALDAGYSESCAKSAAQAIEGPDVRAAFRALVQAAIPPQKIIERLAEGLDADRTTSVESDEVTDSGRKKYVEITEPDFRERREYLKLASNFGGYYIDKQEIDHKVNDGSGDRLAELLAAATARVNGGNDAGGKS